MQKYWAEGPRVQAWGFKIAKILVLGSFALFILAILISELGQFVKISQDMSLRTRFCTAECSFTLTKILFASFCVYSIGLLLALLKSPKGFWLNFLFVFWGIVGLIMISEAADFSYNPLSYPCVDCHRSYMGYIVRNVLMWLWAVLGVAQVFLPLNRRKWAVWTHTGIILLFALAKGILLLLGR